jgi:hypothetical protein
VFRIQFDRERPGLLRGSVSGRSFWLEGAAGDIEDWDRFIYLCIADAMSSQEEHYRVLAE